MKPSQLSFMKKGAKQFGGSLLKGHPKKQRPLALKTPMHLVLKSKNAFGANSMLAKRHVRQIDHLVRKQATVCGVKIYHFVNVGNHLHLVIQLYNRKLYCVFIRAISGLIARQVLGKQRGAKSSNPAVLKVNDTTNPDSESLQSAPVQFWLARPFSRVITWGADFRGIGQYMKKNQAQADKSGARMTEQSAPEVVCFDPMFSSQEFASQLSFMNTA